MNREGVLVIAELMWALRRYGAHTFFPNMPLHKARTLVLVGATVGLAHLRGRPVTLASLSRQRDCRVLRPQIFADIERAQAALSMQQNKWNAKHLLILRVLSQLNAPADGSR